VKRAMPSAILIGEYRWEIVPVEKSVFLATDGVRCYAECSFDEKIIRVAIGSKGKRISRKTVYKRLIHEIYHAVVYSFEESAADTMADVVVDNDLAEIAALLMGKR